MFKSPQNLRDQNNADDKDFRSHKPLRTPIFPLPKYKVNTPLSKFLDEIDDRDTKRVAETIHFYVKIHNTKSFNDGFDYDFSDELSSETDENIGDAIPDFYLRATQLALYSFFGESDYKEDLVDLALDLVSIRNELIEQAEDPSERYKSNIPDGYSSLDELSNLYNH